MNSLALSDCQDKRETCTWTKFQFLRQIIFGTFSNIFIHNLMKKQRMKMKLTVLESWINFLKHTYTGQSVFTFCVLAKWVVNDMNDCKFLLCVTLRAPYLNCGGALPPQMVEKETSCHNLRNGIWLAWYNFLPLTWNNIKVDIPK